MADHIYKQFAIARTVFYLCLLALPLGVIAPSYAQTDTTYTVEGVEADAKAKNAVMAREKALAEAQVKAYRMLAEKLLPPEEMSMFKDIDADTASMLVQDFEVTNEQLSTTRYKGTFTIRFRPSAVRAQLGVRGGLPAQAGGAQQAQVKPVLVLPFLEYNGRTMLWSENNPWMAAWKRAPSDRSMQQQAVVPLGDALDISRLNDEVGLRADPMRVQELATRYGADDVAFAMATSEPVATKGGRLTVNIYKNAFEGPVFVRKFSIDQIPGELEEQLYGRAAMQVKAILRQNWKTGTAAYDPMTSYSGQKPQAPAGRTAAPRTTYGQQPSAPPVPYTRPALGAAQSYNAIARYASAQDWVRMKNTLDRVYGMQAVMVRTLKPREASLEIRYAGTLPALQLALQNAGISMRANPSAGTIELYPAASPVYR
ncbi:MAG: hypothetical protein DI626_07970 [Micavibrio aeruginosavorus]|uniref:DUF2066 domain-containing protein n=1 Tax=Micavibrio aeruginosavorus TaxID=349221 RepID=A0A2W5BNQ0_9BACT|nr:MAG: hypothetical protein DI626_07970 [Micavibrio aeruginosavorus]